MKKKCVSWESKQLQRNVFEIRYSLVRNGDWEAWFLLTSDQHWDNPDSDHDLQLKHLEEAKERNAPVISTGDFFCLMQGKYDRRSAKKIRLEHLGDDYLDLILTDAVKFFSPYAKQFVAIAMGNHEWAIKDRHETNMTERFCGALNYQNQSRVYNGGLAGYVMFRFTDKAGKTVSNIILHYDHGSGGGGPVTKDVIGHFRRSVVYPDADIIVSGHTHDQFMYVQPVERVSMQGAVRQAEQVHLKTPSYKNARKDGFDSWESVKGMPPKPTGAWWLRFYYNRAAERMQFDSIRAQ